MKAIFITLLALLLIAPLAVAKDYGPFVVGTSTVGSTRDTLILSSLYQWVGGESVVGKYLYVATTTDLGAPMNEAMQIEIHTASSGMLALDTASSADAGPSADWTAGDVVWILDTPPSQAKIRTILTSTRIATGVAPINYLAFLQGTADRCTTLVLSVDTPVDSVLAYIHSATGAPAVTGVFPVAGTSLLERVQFLADSLRKVAVSTDTVNIVKLEYAEQLQEDIRDSLAAHGTANRRDVARDSVLVKTNTTNIATLQTLAGANTDSAGQTTLYGTTLASYRNGGVVHSKNVGPGTAAADTFTVATATGNIFVTGLSAEIVTASGQAELINIIFDSNPGTSILRIGQGKDINGITAGAVQSIGLATISNILTDSLAYAGITGAPIAVTAFKMFVTDGTAIKLVMPGASTATVMRVDVNWLPAEKGAVLN
jgi:hypothetical protein